MVISTLAVLLLAGLVAFGVWVVNEGDRSVAERPDKAHTVRTNQVFFVGFGGLIAMMMFILLGVAFAPRAPMLEWTGNVLFAMPFAPLVGALGALAFKKFKK